MADTKHSPTEDDRWFETLPERFEEWSRELGEGELEKLKKIRPDGKTEKKAPNMRNRATRSRMRKGLAFEVRHDLYCHFSRLEDMSSPTGTGKLMMGVEDWARIGRQIAALSPKAFEKALAGAREHLEKLERVAEQAPDFDKQETPPEPARKPARAIGRAHVNPGAGSAALPGDALPWEKPAK